MRTVTSSQISFKPSAVSIDVGTAAGLALLTVFSPFDTWPLAPQSRSHFAASREMSFAMFAFTVTPKDFSHLWTSPASPNFAGSFFVSSFASTELS